METSLLAFSPPILGYNIRVANEEYVFTGKLQIIISHKRYVPPALPPQRLAVFLHLVNE
jgi:hypothetical protein